MRLKRFIGSAGLAASIGIAGLLPAAVPAFADNPTVVVVDPTTGTKITKNDLIGAALTGAWQLGRPAACAQIIKNLTKPGDFSAYGVKCNLGGEVTVTSADPTADGFTLKANVSRSSISSNFTQPYVGKYGDPSANISWDSKLTVTAKVSTSPCTVTPGTPPVPVPFFTFKDAKFEAVNTNVDVNSTLADVLGGITGFFTGFLFGGVGSIPNAVAGAFGTDAIIDGVAQGAVPSGDFNFKDQANQAILNNFSPCEMLQTFGKDITTKHLTIGSVSSALVTLNVQTGVPVAGPAFQARHNLSPDQFQAQFDQLGSQGFRLVDVDGYDDNGAKLAGIWSLATGPAYQARTGLTGDDLGALTAQLGQQGYRLVRLNGYQNGTSTRYAAIWEQRDGPAWAWYYGLTFDDFVSHGNDLGNQGFRLVDISGYPGPDGPRFSGIWEQRDGPAYQVRIGLSESDLAAFGDQFGPQGYRLSRISGYADGIESRYAVIWEQKDGPAWQWYFGLSPADYQSTFDRVLFQGYRLAQVTAFNVGGQPKFAGLWTQ